MLDAGNGTTLLTVPFTHALDGPASVLGEPEELTIRLASRRTSAVDTGSGRRGGHLQLSPITLEGGRGTSTGLAPPAVPESHVPVPRLDPRADAPAYAVAHAYRRLPADLREGTSSVPDFAHGAARHRGIG